MDDAARKLFADHDRNWRDNRWAYPVVSRRSRGLSLGVNLNPDMACNFDCTYCSVDRRETPRTTVVELDGLERELADLLAKANDGRIWRERPFDTTPDALRRLNDVAFSGDGEPTAAKEFPDACAIVARLLGWLGLDQVKTVVITNATLLDRPGFAAGMRALGTRPVEIWAKLDAGTQGYYEVVDRSKVPLSRVLANILALGRSRPVVVQAMFCRMHGEPAPQSELDAWAGRLRELRDGGCAIDRVQIYTTARHTAEPWVSGMTPAELASIADRVRALGLGAEVHP